MTRESFPWLRPPGVVARTSSWATGHRDLRPGVTLLELLVALTVLGSLAGISVLALRTYDPAATPAMTMSNSLSRLVRTAQSTAVSAGRVVALTIPSPTGPKELAAYPDGSVIADEALGIERFTGRSTTRATLTSDAQLDGTHASHHAP